MAKFTDRDGNDWFIDIDTTLLKKLRAMEIDLLHKDPKKAGSALAQLMEDPIFLVDTLYLMCQEQAEKREISDEQFGRLVGRGDTITDATKALVAAFTDFSPRRGEILELAMEKLELIEGRMSEAAKGALEDIDLDEITSQFGKSLTSALGSSKLIPDPLNSES